MSGPRSPDLAHVTIPKALRKAVAAHPDAVAIVASAAGIRLTYQEFSDQVTACAAGLHALGVRKGDRVGIWSPNRVEWVLTQFATARIGAILVNINPAYRLSELEYALNKVGCTALITARDFKTSNYVAMLQELAPELAQDGAVLQAAKLPDLRHVIVLDDTPVAGMMSFDALCAGGDAVPRADLDAIEAALDPDDAINIQFTSGTTGAPKGATLTHKNIVNNARFVTDRIDLGPGDGLVIPVPLYHCFGMVMGVLGALSKGAKMVFPSEGFEPAATLDAVEAEQAVALYGVPTMFVAMLQELEAKPRDLSSLRTGIMAGTVCPIDTMNRVIADMNMSEVTICYGMTETSPVSFQSFGSDPIDKRCETVGRIHPHLDVKIIGEDGAPVPIGEPGELCTHGYSVMQGYWGDDAATQDSIRDGWMHSGDLATMDGDGFCTIVGRSKDMIIRGGENIYPREVEDFLLRHENVLEAQVFGIPDTHFGEIVCAWIIAKPGSDVSQDGLRGFCDGQIAHFKIPTHIRVVDTLPMTVTGKPQKFIMRDQMQEMLASAPS